MVAPRPLTALLTLALLTIAALTAGPPLGSSPSAASAGRPASAATSGTFVDSRQALTADALGAALGDLDGDGDLDAALAASAGVALWRNNGGGSFASAGPALGSAYAIAVALSDLDGDSDLDLFSLEDTAQSNQVWLNQGGGSFSFAGGQAFGDDLASGLALGDVDGDSDIDAFVTRIVGRPSKVWLNNGAGSFTDSGQSLSAGDSSGVALGDLDGDGDLDAFVAGGDVDTVWLNQGQAQGGSPGAYANSGQSLADALSNNVALSDLDRDGDLDAATASVNSGVHLWVNQGGAQAGTAGVFAAGGVLGTSGNRHVAPSDVDGDGDQDLFVARGDADTVWLNQGGVQGGAAGAFADSGQRLDNLFSAGAALADLDGDHDADALVANASAAAQVWRNEGISGLQTAYQIRDSVLAGSARGRHYIDLYNAHGPEIVSLILADRNLFNNGYITLTRWLPGLQTLVDGSGGGAVIVQAQVDALDGFLGDLAAAGSADLQQDIAAERAALPNLDSFVGQTMVEARSAILGAPSSHTYLPVVRAGRAQALNQAQARQGNTPQQLAFCPVICLLAGVCH
jgi:hypothetical protein